MLRNIDPYLEADPYTYQPKHTLNISVSLPPSHTEKKTETHSFLLDIGYLKRHQSEIMHFCDSDI